MTHIPDTPSPRSTGGDSPHHPAPARGETEASNCADPAFVRWLAAQTFRVGPRHYEGARCHECGAEATYMLARPYDLSPGGEIATPACAEHAMGWPEWTPGGTATAMHAKWKNELAAVPSGAPSRE